MTSNIKFPKPPTYDGSRDGFVLLSWLNALHRYFDGADVPDDKKTVHAVSYLVGLAGLWWEGKAFGHKVSYEFFEKQILAEFLPDDFLDSVRNLLVTAKMETTIPEYVARFRKYLNVLYSSHMKDGGREELDKMARSAFLQGCPIELRTMLLSFEIGPNAPTDLHGLLSSAERYDRLYHYKIHNTGSTSHFPFKIHSSPRPQDNSMAMEIDNLQLQVNAMANAIGYQSQFRPKTLNSPLRPTQNRPITYHPPSQNARPFNQRPNYQRPNNQLPPLTQEE
ncbi:hypothetical protein BGZ76_005513, partial [Entomortierella beljakovae]